jgi:hypothetical protein
MKYYGQIPPELIEKLREPTIDTVKVMAFYEAS